MNSLSESELLFYGGLAAMGIAVVLMAACALIFALTGRKLKERLKAEYGEPVK